MKQLSSSNKILVWIGALVVLAIVVASVLNSSAVTTYAADTPEGVVQRYVNAVLDGDEDAADAYLTTELATECENEEFPILYREDDSARVALLDSSISGDTARVDVRVTEGSYGLVDSYEYDHEETFDLERTENGWLISDQTWPRYGC